MELPKSPRMMSQKRDNVPEAQDNIPSRITAKWRSQELSLPLFHVVLFQHAWLITHEGPSMLIRHMLQALESV